MDSTDNTRPTPSSSPFQEAYFHNTASDPSDTLLVVIPDFSLDQPFGDPYGVVWSPLGGALPQAGDRALVAESTDGTWWVVSWWSDAQNTGVAPAAVDALDTRLDTIEAHRHLLGPYTATSGALAAGGTATVTVTHNLGTTDYYVLGEPQDAGFGYSVNWIAGKSANTVDIAFRNNGGIAGAALRINFFLAIN